MRAALIGYGRRGTQQAATLSELPELFEFAAVCDPNAAAVEKAVGLYGCKGYTSVRELFANEKLDVVVLVTPPELHHIGVKAAADHGVNLLVETPLATTRPMMDLIAETAERAKIVVEVAENYGRRPVEVLNRQVIEAGLIGKLVHITVFNGPANQDSAYHVVSQVRAYAGGADVTQVQAISRSNESPGLRPGGDSLTHEHWVDAVLTLDNRMSATVNYVTSWTSPHRWTRPRIACVEGTDGYLVTADGGGAYRMHRVENGQQRDAALQVESEQRGGQAVAVGFSYEGHPELRVANQFANVKTEAGPGSVCDGIGRAAELLSLHRAVTEGVPVGYGLARGRRSQEVGLAIMEAARLNHPISPDLDDETEWERGEHDRFRARFGADPFKDMDKLI